VTRYDLVFGHHYRELTSGAVTVYRGCWGSRHFFYCLDREDQVITRDADSDVWTESFVPLNEMEVIAWMASPQL
jgi:hypothetical protein